MPHLLLNKDKNVIVGSTGMAGIGGAGHELAQLISFARLYFIEALMVP